MHQRQSNQQLATIGNRQTLRTLLDKGNVTTTLERVATKWLKADQVKTQAQLAVARNPGLLQCTPASFLESMVRASELGLRFAGAGGEAYLVPYKNSCTLIIGYRGLCALARRTGLVTRIEARCVHEKDTFEISYGSGQQIRHQPHLGIDRGELTCAYAIAELKGGDMQIEVMTRVDLDAIKNRSRAGDRGPWKTDYEEMCRKTVVRRLCKYLPFPAAFEDALATADPEEPEEQDCDRRRPVESTTLAPDDEDQSGAVPDGVDPATGEILCADITEVLDEPDSQPGPQTLPPGEDKYAAQKTSVLGQIWEELNMQFPSDTPQDQAGRLKALKHVFGHTNIEAIGNMPIEILKAGLGALKNQAVAAEGE